MTLDLARDLNEAQLAAVEYIGGPELVIAGAGSGKTRVITYKIAYLLEKGYSPYGIMALTFTNKAAHEMRERVCAMVGEEIASKLWMGTFHSIFARILRRHAELIGYKSNFTIYDSADSKSLISSIIKELKLDSKTYRPGQVASDISQAKNNLYSPEDYAADEAIAQGNRYTHTPEMPRIYTMYRDRCRVAGAMDFDDLLFYINVLFRDNPDILAKYKEYFKYILVDEYQDTNFAQHVIIRQLCAPDGRLCVVGDDAQSIYAFRGANIRNILDLKKTFPSLRTFKLEENYRSTKNILAAANSLIAANVEQIKKTIYSNNEVGERVEVLQAYNDYEEAYAIASRAMQVRRKYHLNYNDIAVLYRTNAQSRVLEEALRARSIPYRIYGGLAFYQRKEIKDAVAFFRLSINPDDDEALTRVVNVPKRGIGDTTVGKLRTAAIEHRVSIYTVMCDPEAYGVKITKGTLAKLDAFTGMVQDFADKNAGTEADELAAHIIETTGLLKQYISDNECVSQRENLYELMNAVKAFSARMRVDMETPSMTDFLAETSLLSETDSEDGVTDCVTLMTIHSAKGLEFDAVFVAGAEEKLLPSEKCRTAAEVEEERRLMYVAITRAKQFCMISFATQRTLNGNSGPSAHSRFLSDIDPRYLDKAKGTRIAGKSSSTQPNVRSESPRTSPLIERPSQSKPSVTVRQPIVAEKVTASRTIGITQTPKAQAAGASGDFVCHTVSELKEGMRIDHSSHHQGMIEKIDASGMDAKIVVTFDADGMSRTLLLKFARFKIIQ